MVATPHLGARERSPSRNYDDLYGHAFSLSCAVILAVIRNVPRRSRNRNGAECLHGVDIPGFLVRGGTVIGELQYGSYWDLYHHLPT
jgi:hypothetical protein